ncbi:phosphotransferase [Arthrobacter sp. Sa2BUA2]|uniref:Phosphotransferase n=1 Tax=Arthrobacter pullicola TaxID=2762224 RepID=A0ABR8YIV4_9MICC|nr:phosphotransferase [Arthrobacter pullicola]MBD8044161.1 phosphotransferase [Arthrobacter pullicola]
MKRTPMELAALASAAVPALALTGVAGSPDDVADFDSALLVDDAGKQWRVRSPKHVEASMRLETELLVLRAFVPAVRAELPFALPYVAGTVRQGELCTFVYSHLPGTTRDIDDLAALGSELAADIGRTMAAVHALPQSLVHNADLPSYTANEFRQRKLNELDQAATTGKIPATLLRRWEHALEDVGLWRFSPTVVHGDLHEDNLLISGSRVSAVSGWTDLRIGDPADDFAWLIAANNTGFTDAVHAAYVAARPDAVDPHLIRRAALSAEFALAQWLVRGLAAQNPDMVAEAEEMLSTLEADILEQEAALAAARESAAPLAGAAVPDTLVVSSRPPVERQASSPAPAGVASSVAAGSQPGPQAGAKVSVLPITGTGESQETTVSGGEAPVEQDSGDLESTEPSPDRAAPAAEESGISPKAPAPAKTDSEAGTSTTAIPLAAAKASEADKDPSPAG